MKYRVNLVVDGLVIRGTTVYTSYDIAVKMLNRVMTEYRGLYGFVSAD